VASGDDMSAKELTDSLSPDALSILAKELGSDWAAIKEMAGIS
jgi:hypothetical protein